MTDYYPDKWVVVKLKAGKLDHGIYKVLATFYGGYLDGDMWRMNSGIMKVEETDTQFIFHGFSGSKYHCHKEMYGLSMVTSGAYQHWKTQEAFDDQITIMDPDTNWMTICD